MSVVTFDAPQSVGDELLDVDGLGELDGTIIDESQNESITEIAEDLGLAEVVAQEPPTATITSDSVATEVSGDPLQSVNHQLTQLARETSVDHYESERSEEADLLDQIWNAERDCRKAESRVELLKEELKEAKSQYEQSMLRLREIINENSGCFHNSSRPVRVEVEPHRVPEIKDWTAPADITIVPQDETQPAEPETINPLAWRAVSLEELFREPIKGLGAKKQEALIDLCPTLGDLEDLRATVGKAAAQFHELLPKGIGLETASTIEDRLLDWIARNPKACAEVGTDGATLETRADQLADDPTGLVARHPDGNGYWTSGREAYHANAVIADCPWTPGVEQDDWLRGWMAADNDDKESKAPETEPAGEAEARILHQASSLDDL